jgi:hypothetical protein
MKKYFFILFVFSAVSSFSQTDFTTVKLSADADYKLAEKSVLEASNYVLSTPLDGKNLRLQAATKFLLQWMEGTPDYTYIIESPLVTKLNSENEGLTGVYYAGMTKFSLENKAKTDDPQLTMINGIRTVLAYAEKTEHKVAQTETLKKITELNKKGELETLLK